MEGKEKKRDEDEEIFSPHPKRHYLLPKPRNWPRFVSEYDSSGENDTFKTRSISKVLSGHPDAASQSRTVQSSEARG